MNTSLLVRAFQHLQSKEARGFLDFVRCPLFNRRAELVRLCEYMLAHVGKPAQNAFEAVSLYEAAHPGEPYDNNRLRHTMSYLLDALRSFLSHMELESDPAEMQQTLVRALRQRGMDKLFDKAMGKAAAQEERAEVRDAQYHFRQYQLHQEKLEHTARHERSARLNLQPLPDELTTFYVAEMLRHACSGLMHQAVSSQSYQMQLLDSIIEVAEQGELLKAPAVAIYYHAYKMLLSPDDDAPFEHLKALLKEHSVRFSQQEMRGLHLMVINGCIRRMNSGKRHFIREAFEAYRTALEHNFLTEHGIMTSFTYKNIIRIGAALKEHEWTEHFIEDYRKTLHPRERENAYRYNRAFLYFQKGDYTHAMPLLQQAEFEDPLNNLHARRLLVRSYVELGEHDALESLLQSFQAYLKRQKNLGYHTDLNLNFLKYVTAYYKLKPNDIKAKQLLLEKLVLETHVPEREWLMEKLGAKSLQSL